MVKKKLLISMGVFAALLVAGFCTLALVLSHHVRGEFFDSAGVKIHYTDQGEGEPVILVHGYSANSDVNWRLPGVLPRLQKHFRVITMDVRGHGLSEKPHDPKKYGIEMVNDVERLMDHLKIQKAHLVGYSMGGFITLKFMTMHPERLISAMPCGAAWMEPDSPLSRLAQDIYAQLNAPLSAPGKGAIQRIVERSLVKSMNDMECLHEVADTFGQLAITEQEVRAIHVPMMAVRAEHEELVNGGRDFKEFMPGYQLTLCPHGLHSTVIFFPAFGEAIENFLLSQSAQKG